MISLLRVGQTALTLGVCQNTVRQYCDAGLLEYQRLGKDRFLNRKEVEDLKAYCEERGSLVNREMIREWRKARGKA
jgi:hypothetical protein